MLGFALMARDLAWKRTYGNHSSGFIPAGRNDASYLRHPRLWPATTEYYKIIDRAERMQRLLALIPGPPPPWRLHL